MQFTYWLLPTVCVFISQLHGSVQVLVRLLFCLLPYWYPMSCATCLVAWRAVLAKTKSKVGKAPLGNCDMFTLSICIHGMDDCVILLSGTSSPAGSIPFILIMLLTVIILLLATFAIMAWWIADLVIFAKNDRLAGSGCMLRPTL